MENIVKETSLLERTGVFDEDAKRRFELRLTYNGMKVKDSSGWHQSGIQ